MLSGIRILDFTQYVPGPFASMRLADLGAEVVKVEAPQGDLARQTGVSRNGEGVVFRANNRNKKSICIDLKTEAGQAVALQLIEQADVLLEGFRPGVMERLGLGYKAVAARNPRVVYCSVTGFGNEGAFGKHGSHDLNYMAVSGMLAQLKGSDGRPVHPTTMFADYFGAMAVNEQVLAGLLARDRTGEGSYCCIAIADVVTSLMGHHVLVQQETGDRHGISVLSGQQLSYAIYETKDERFIALAALEEKFWRSFCLAVERPDWLKEHMALTGTEVHREVAALFRSRTLQQWIVFGQQVDCCLTPVLEADELLHSPFSQGRGVVRSSDWGDLQTGMPGMKEQAAPPAKGQHTDEVLQQWLSLTQSDMQTLRLQGVII